MVTSSRHASSGGGGGGGGGGDDGVRVAMPHLRVGHHQELDLFPTRTWCALDQLEHAFMAIILADD